MLDSGCSGRGGMPPDDVVPADELGEEASVGGSGSAAPGPDAGAHGTAKITARDVERQFNTDDGELNALGPLTLEIGDGEFVCIVGPSGCGKSTFLRIVAGLI